MKTIPVLLSATIAISVSAASAVDAVPGAGVKERIERIRQAVSKGNVDILKKAGDGEFILAQFTQGFVNCFRKASSGGGTC